MCPAAAQASPNALMLGDPVDLKGLPRLAAIISGGGVLEHTNEWHDHL